jgi:phosphoadenosine phosphosulfate reductase
MTIATKAISVTEYELGKLAEQFENGGIEELLEWAADRFAPRLVMTSNFGAEGVVLIDHLARVAPKTPVVYLSTGFQFAETDELKERLRERYDLNIVQAESELTVEEQNRIHGEQLYQTNSDLCCKIRKVEPLQNALLGYDAWIAALRRDQSPTRANIKTIEWNARNNLVKIHPLAAWTRAKVWNYILTTKGTPALAASLARAKPLLAHTNAADAGTEIRRWSVEFTSKLRDRAGKSELTSLRAGVYNAPVFRCNNHNQSRICFTTNRPVRAGLASGLARRGRVGD